MLRRSISPPSHRSAVRSIGFCFALASTSSLRSGLAARRVQVLRNRRSSRPESVFKSLRNQRSSASGIRSLAPALLAHLLGGGAVLLLPSVQQILCDAEAYRYVSHGPFASSFEQPNSFTLELFGVLLPLPYRLRFRELTPRIPSSLGVLEIRGSSGHRPAHQVDNRVPAASCPL
jgi:hypothetical protein